MKHRDSFVFNTYECLATSLARSREEYRCIACGHACTWHGGRTVKQVRPEISGSSRGRRLDHCCLWNFARSAGCRLPVSRRLVVRPAWPPLRINRFCSARDNGLFLLLFHEYLASFPCRNSACDGMEQPDAAGNLLGYRGQLATEPPCNRIWSPIHS